MNSESTRPAASRTDETSVSEAASRYQALFPQADVEAVNIQLALTRTFRAVLLAMNESILPQKGLTRAEYDFLTTLFLAEGNRRTLSEIAREMTVTPTYVTRVLDELERDGLVERQANPLDRRVTYAHLTAEGLARSASLVPAYLEFMEDLAEAFTREERAEFLRLLSKYECRAQDLKEPGD